MTIRVDDDLGPETPEDPEFDFDGQIEFIITIEDGEADEDDGAANDSTETAPEVVDASDNLVIDDDDLIDGDLGDSDSDDPELLADEDEDEQVAEAEEADLEADVDTEADEVEADEVDFDAEADLGDESHIDDEAEAETELDSEADVDMAAADEIDLTADGEVDAEVGGEVAEVVDRRPDHETDLEFETIFLAEADGAIPDNGDLAQANGLAPIDEVPVDEVPVDEAVEAPATQDDVAAVDQTAPIADEPTEIGQEPTDDPQPGLVEESTMEVFPAAESAGNTWSLARVTSVAAPAMAAVLVLGAVGYAFGRLGGGEEVVRREFVYTLDESVPDSFLREDRRLLTQIVTIESDSVLAPVAEDFDLSIDDLRDKIAVETVDLSEVLRLEVTDESRTTALALSEAVIEQYLLVSSNPLPSERSSALRTQRDGVVADLAEADAALLALQQDRREDAQLETQEESLQRQIDLTTEHLNRLEGLIEDSLVSALTNARRSTLEGEKATADLELVELEAQLAAVRTERAQLAEQSAEESALGREINRLESDLTIVEDELARRELGPLVASPVRALSEPSVMTVTAHRAGLQGLAGGVMLGIPIAALVAYRVRKRQLWLD